MQAINRREMAALMLGAAAAAAGLAMMASPAESAPLAAVKSLPAAGEIPAEKTVVVRRRRRKVCWWHRGRRVCRWRWV